MLVGAPSGFNYITGNVLTTRPATAYGTVITPAQNAYGSYTEILSDTSVTRDCYGILININSNNATTAARNTIVTIGVDTSGGTSYVTLIPDLLGSCAAPLTITGALGGIWYYFPVFIKNGTALAAKASVNNATVGTLRVACWLFGDPTHPHLIRCGQGVEAIGITAASSSGTAVTSGTTNEGAWTSLGTTTRTCFAWQLGMGVNDGTMSAVSYNLDLAADNNATAPKIIIQDAMAASNSTEQFSLTQQDAYMDVASGATMYGRMQCSGTADASLSMAAYGVY